MVAKPNWGGTPIYTLSSKANAAGVVPDTLTITGITLGYSLLSVHGNTATIKLFESTNTDVETAGAIDLVAGQFRSYLDVLSKASRRGVADAYAMSAFVDVRIYGALTVDCAITKTADGVIIFETVEPAAVPVTVVLTFPQDR